MNKPNTRRTSTAIWISFLVILASLAVMAGWIWDINALKSLLPHWVTMKFTTALSFFLSGITLYYIITSWEGDSSVAHLVLPVTTLGLLLLMTTPLLSTLMNVHTGIEDLFVRESPGAVKTTTPGRPSLITMIAFILMAVAGILSLLLFVNLKPKLIIIGRMITGIGGLAILGYIFNQPLLYYTVQGWSTAMAFHTAALFVMLGTGIMLLKKREENKPQFISIQRKVVIVFLALSTIPMFFIGALTYSNARNSLAKTTLERLITITEFKESELFLFLENLETWTKSLASDAYLSHKLNAAAHQNPEAASAFEELNRYLGGKKLLDDKLLAIDLLDSSGKVAASTHPEFLGLDKSGEEYFKQGLKRVFIKDMHYEFHDILEIDIAAPIRKPAQPDEVLGILLVHFKASLLKKLIAGEMVMEMGALTQVRGLGKTGETYLVNQDRVMITDSRFIKDAILRKKVNTWPVNQCLDENKEVTGDWVDYRGVSAIGASMCMDFGDFKWTLVSEQDKNEVFATIDKLRNVTIFILLLSLSLVLLVAISIANSISRPIQALQKGAEIIGGGNLDHKVGITETDEIGRLSVAFDQMAQNLKTSMGRLGSVMQIAPVGIAISSPSHDEGISDVNLTLLKMLGYSSGEEFSKLSVSSFYANPGDREQLNELRKKGVVTDFKIDLKRKDGSVFPASLSSLTFTEADGKTRVLSIIQDITERKRFEENLRHAKEEAEQSNRLKSEFIANVSHELRTPLTSLIGFPDIIRSILEKQPDLTQKDFHTILHCNQIISNQGKVLLELINDLIDLSQFETGDIELTETPILAHSLISSLLNIFNSRAKEKSITLADNCQEQDDFCFMGDIKRLEQVLYNLLDNAIKFSHKGTVKLSAFNKEERVIFQVRDEGTGITREQTSFIFDKFRQLDGSSTRAHGGLGLGLDLVKRLLEKMNGEISVESELGKGSTFTIDLPWKRRDMERKEQTVDDESLFETLSGKKVLIVEDDQDIQFLAQAFLPKNEFSFAENGAKALEALQNSKDFDVIFLDRRMPVMDGDTFMKKMVANFPQLNIPVLMLTAAVQDEEKMSAEKLAQELGVTFKYLTKPFDEKSLITALNEIGVK